MIMLLKVSLSVDHTRLAPGGSIIATLAVSNRGPDVALQFLSTQRCDFVFKDSRNRTIWTWSDGRMFGQAIGVVELGAGKPQLVCRERFVVPRTPGTYRLVGTVVAVDQALSSSVIITVG